MAREYEVVSVHDAWPTTILTSTLSILTRWPSCCPTLTPDLISNPNPHPNQVAIVLSKTLLLFTTEEVSKQSILAASLLFVKVSSPVRKVHGDKAEVLWISRASTPPSPLVKKYSRSVPRLN